MSYTTSLGAAIVGKSDAVLRSKALSSLRHKVQLIFTSPPFPLNRKKKYGNETGEAYKEWLQSFAPTFADLLTNDGSIVIELGNAWAKNKPVMSTLGLESLLAFKDAGRFHLCQEFIWYNPARLPTPAQWVNIDRIRVKDAFTRLWWLSPNERPKADNRQVLKPYSASMEQLLRSQKYNSGKRPSEHVIGKSSFLRRNNGAIPPNVLDARSVPGLESFLECSNTKSDSTYLKYCVDHDLVPHPARMPAALAEFFIRLCSDVGDVVLDPFAGSNTTGAAAEALKRRWLAIEAERPYAESGIGHFDPARLVSHR